MFQSKGNESEEWTINPKDPRNLGNFQSLHRSPEFTCSETVLRTLDGTSKAGWKFYCAWCQAWHLHSASPGHRHVHCADRIDERSLNVISRRSDSPLAQVGGYALHLGGYAFDELQRLDNETEFVGWFVSMAVLWHETQGLNIPLKAVSREIETTIKLLAGKRRSDAEALSALHLPEVLALIQATERPNGESMEPTMTRKPVVEFLKEGDAMGVRTTAANPDEFLRETAAQLGLLIDSQTYVNDWEFQLDHWLPAMCEVWARLKGYKAEVFEQRVIYSGDPFAFDMSPVIPAAPRTEEPVE